VYYQVHDEGDGYMPYYGGKVRVRFQGFTLDGTKFVDTFGETNPREFVLGQGNEGGATAGLNIGIHALQVGDSATIYVPSPLGYQNQSVGNNVPANSILVYNVKFEAIKNLESELVKIDEYIEDKSFNAEIDERYGTRYVIHKSGSGPTPVYNQSITTHYILQSLGGNEYDNSYKRTPPTPFQFRYATGQVIPGFHMGFENLQQGDSATFFVPSTYGYREAGQGDIPPNAVLVFGVRVENFGGLQ
jgi:FKBP-type peptidyl-prolyl cis-trans isomerase